jgi:phosphopantothenoylcysteine decarboxylase/phosphopantothenate--cysteine ligase
MFAREVAGELHVELAASADAIALVPATAELLASLAQGRATDLVRATALCADCPVLAAPAMHPRMWSHPATARNVATLRADGRVELIGPVAGEVASGDVGLGRMAEPAAIAQRLLSLLDRRRDLDGLRILVSAGPTVEDIDPARYLSNRSSGKMGFAVAERAAARGARCVLVAGPVALQTPAGVERIDVRSAADMSAALWQQLGDDLGGVDALVMVAAVADFRPKSAHDEKLKRGKASEMTLELVANPDVLAAIGARRQAARPMLVGFALETAGDDAIVDIARRKLSAKRVDLIVANHASDAFDKDTNRATLVAANDATPLGTMDKRALADAILDRVRSHHGG